ncbi:hypothetical protein SAMN05519103_09507 [Rhizobiales bacterium GAS113]|nr:hypothetical protein SAMN05519103_09507 [Rhizobiales bacterium GAS113]
MTGSDRDAKAGHTIIEKEKIAAKVGPVSKREKLIDATLRESFPASDPPSKYGRGGHRRA